MKRISLLSLVGSLLALLGLAVVSAWVFGVPRLTDMAPQQANMVFNTAFCFLIAGLAFFAAEQIPRFNTSIFLTSGAILLFMGGITLSQYFFKYASGLDEFFIKDWLIKNNSHPGRMSVSSALIFLSTGLIFTLLPFSKHKIFNYLIQATAISVALLGVLALIGHGFDIDFLYNWYSYSPIAIHTACGYLLLGVGLGALYYKTNDFLGFRQESMDKKILLLSAIILFCIASIAGLFGFTVSSHQDESTRQLSLQELLQDKVTLLQDNINQSILEMDNITKDPHLKSILFNLEAIHHEDPRAVTRLLLNSSFSAIQLRNPQGGKRYSSGAFIERPTSTVALDLPYAAQLLWKNGFRLQLSMPLSFQGKTRVLVLQWSLDAFNHLFSAHNAANDNQISLCFSTPAKKLACLPPQPSSALLSNSLSPDELQELLHFTQSSMPGIIKNIYSGQKNSLLIYSPLGKQALGLVIKPDLEEIYRPLRKELFLVIPTLLFAISFGAFLLYWRVSPLVRKLYESEAQSQAAFNHSAIGMAMVGPEGRWLKVNAALCRILGYKESEFLKMDFQSITYPADLGISLEKTQLALGGELDHFEITKRYFHKTGKIVWALLNVSIIRDPAQNPLYFIAQIQDITEQKHFQEELNYQAHYDNLTGLANRTLLERDLNKLIAQCERNSKQFVVFFIDMDHFKQVNDSLGHDAGDRLLVTVAERLKNHTRKSDLVARIGGDEFVVILPEVYDYEAAAVFAEKICSVLLKPFKINGRELFITVSIGISIYPGDGDSYATLIKNADQALYQAKEKGRNNYQFCAPGISVSLKEKMTFEMALQQALTKDEFQIYYLPQLDVIYNRIAQVEALLRWQSKQYGVVSPQQIFPLAEENGLIIPLSSWITRSACQQVQIWQKNNHSTLRVAINISASQFFHGNLIDSINEELKLTQFNPAYFTVEIAEAVIMQDPQISKYLLGVLKKHGIKVTIDNFGTGYSSLVNLQDFEIDALKIDRGLIDQMLTDPKRAVLVIAIIDLAKNLGIKVMAEGVESKEQFDFLAKHSCDEIQGYYLAKPMLAEEMLKFLEAYSSKKVSSPA